MLGLEEVTGLVLWDKPYTGDVTPTQLTDRSRWGNDGALTDAPTATRLDNGLWVWLFNGSSNYITIADDVSTKFAGDFTAMVWGKTVNPTIADRVMGNRDSAGANLGWSLDIGATGHLGVRADNGAVDVQALGTTTVITDGKWHLLGGRRSGTSIQAFTDGEADGSAQTLSGSIASTAATQIGRSPAVGNLWDGYLALTKIWNRPLSQPEIRAIYQNERHYFGV